MHESSLGCSLLRRKWRSTKCVSSPARVGAEAIKQRQVALLAEVEAEGKGVGPRQRERLAAAGCAGTNWLPTPLLTIPRVIVPLHGIKTDQNHL